MDPYKLPEWAQFIIGQALTDVTDEESAEKVKGDLRGTALQTNEKYIKIAFELIDLKLKAMGF